MTSLAFILATLHVALSQTLPKWVPTYDMNSSTVIQLCNYSGYFSNEALGQLVHYGIVDIDWSHAKMLWSNVYPMNDQESMLTQAKILKKANPVQHVWVYRLSIFISNICTSNTYNLTYH